MLPLHQASDLTQILVRYILLLLSNNGSNQRVESEFKLDVDLSVIDPSQGAAGQSSGNPAFRDAWSSDED